MKKITLKTVCHPNIMEHGFNESYGNEIDQTLKERKLYKEKKRASE